MEKLYEIWKNLVVTKNSLLTPRFPDLDAPVYNVQPHFAWHKYYSSIVSTFTMFTNFPIFHLVFIIMYIILDYEQSCVRRCKDYLLTLHMQLHSAMLVKTCIFS